MIPVVPADEPAGFDARVRQRGLDAIAELVGEPRSKPRRGRKRTTVYPSRDKIRSDEFPPLWTEVLPDLRQAYQGMCAYLGLYIEHGTGAPSVDHFVAKSKNWQLVYEWSNYRLCSSLVNGHRSNRDVALDPFHMNTGLFALEFTDFQVVPGPNASSTQHARILDTVDVLGLNQLDCRKAREEYVAAYRDGPPMGIALDRLERRAPFVAMELRRQGQLVRGDT